LDGLLMPDIIKATKALSGIQVGSQQFVVLGHVQDAVEKSLGQCTQVIANMSTIGRRHLTNFSEGSDCRCEAVHPQARKTQEEVL